MSLNIQCWAATDHVGQAAGDHDVSGAVPLLALGVRHQEAQLHPRGRDPGHHLALVLEAHADALHLQDPVPGLEARVVGGGVRLHAGDVALAWTRTHNQTMCDGSVTCVTQGVITVTCHASL